MEGDDAEIHRMSHEPIRSASYEPVPGEQIHPDPVAPTEGPHRPGGEEGRGHRHREPDQTQLERERDGRWNEVGDHERDPHERRVVLDIPGRVRAKQVPALSAKDPQGSRREKDDVR